MDAIGRHSRKIILPPPIALPDIDRVVARRYGVTRRLVRSIRRDKRMWLFMPHLPWKVPDWQLQGVAQHAAKRLMTKARYEKQERVTLTKDGLAVEQVRGPEALYIAAWKVFGVLRRCEDRMPPEHRHPPMWLAHQPQWARIVARGVGGARRIKPKAGAE